MRSVVGRLVLALLFFIAGAVLMSEARETRRLAGFHERLVTLQHDRGNGEPEDAAPSRPWWRPGFLSRSNAADTATAQYWRHQYDVLTDPAASASAGDNPDSGRLFLAANAAYRAALDRPAGDRAMAVERLDRVVEAYASVLRAAPGHVDAAYNYEYVARSRDTLARGAKDKRMTKVAAAPPIVDPIPSPDLPVGPTLHGHPGGPPPDIPGSDFRMIAPMSFEEREESEPGQGPAPKRRG
jgi:hypothetical protein